MSNEPNVVTRVVKEAFQSKSMSRNTVTAILSLLLILGGQVPAIAAFSDWHVPNSRPDSPGNNGDTWRYLSTRNSTYGNVHITLRFDSNHNLDPSSSHVTYEPLVHVAPGHLSRQSVWAYYPNSRDTNTMYRDAVNRAWVEVGGGDNMMPADTALLLIHAWNDYNYGPWSGPPATKTRLHPPVTPPVEPLFTDTRGSPLLRPSSFLLPIHYSEL